MLIESIIQREGGTIIDMPGARYKFIPDSEGRHVAEVGNATHCAMLLAISEGYRSAGQEAAPVAPMMPTTEELQRAFDKAKADGLAAALKESAERSAALAESDAAEEAAKGQAEDKSNAGIDNSKVEQTLDRGTLVKAYTARFGHPPHHNMKTESIAAKLAGGAE